MNAELDLTQIPKFHAGIAAELNFVGEKLKKLPAVKCKVIYDGLHAPQDSTLFAEAVVGLLILIIEAPDTELTEYVNRVFNTSFTFYVFTNAFEKAHLFTAFFFNHLRMNGNEFTVGQIDLKTLTVSY